MWGALGWVNPSTLAGLGPGHLGDQAPASLQCSPSDATAPTLCHTPGALLQLHTLQAQHIQDLPLCLFCEAPWEGEERDRRAWDISLSGSPWLHHSSKTEAEALPSLPPTSPQHPAQQDGVWQAVGGGGGPSHAGRAGGSPFTRVCRQMASEGMLTGSSSQSTE